jgi:cell division protein FtsB
VARKRPGLSRIVWGVVILGAMVFAVQAGEYTTMDLVRQRDAKRTIERQVDSLRALNDSLERALHAVHSDPATQERIAREEFGMVRGEKEILYRFADVVDTLKGPR